MDDKDHFQNISQTYITIKYKTLINSSAYLIIFYCDIQNVGITHLNLNEVNRMHTHIQK